VRGKKNVPGEFHREEGLPCGKVPIPRFELQLRGFRPDIGIYDGNVK
jgi:hypothetical protein